MSPVEAGGWNSSCVRGPQFMPRHTDSAGFRKARPFLGDISSGRIHKVLILQSLDKELPGCKSLDDDHAATA